MTPVLFVGQNTRQDCGTGLMILTLKAVDMEMGDIKPAKLQSLLLMCIKGSQPVFLEIFHTNFPPGGFRGMTVSW